MTTHWGEDIRRRCIQTRISDLWFVLLDDIAIKLAGLRSSNFLGALALDFAGVDTSENVFVHSSRYIVTGFSESFRDTHPAIASDFLG